VNAFLLAEDAKWDLGDLPLFMQTFHSGSMGFEQDRAWTLQVIAKGIASPKDVSILNRRFVLESAMDFFASSRSDVPSRRAVLNVLRSVARTSGGSNGDIGAKALIERGFLGFCVDVLDQLTSSTNEPIWRVGDDRGEESKLIMARELTEILLLVSSKRATFSEKVAKRDEGEQAAAKRPKGYLAAHGRL